MHTDLFEIRKIGYSRYNVYSDYRYLGDINLSFGTTHIFIGSANVINASELRKIADTLDELNMTAENNIVDVLKEFIISTKEGINKLEKTLK